MGGKTSKEQPLTFGSFKVTGNSLYKEAVVVLEPGEIALGKSKDLIVRFSSYQRGVFHVRAKYLGAVVKEVAFKHEYLIELLHGAQSDQMYQLLSERLSYQRQGTKLMLGRGWGFDVTRLLPYLYVRFAGQDLTEEGEQLVQRTHFRRLDSISRASRPNGGGGGSSASNQQQWPDQDMSRHVEELEALERALRA